MAMQRQLWSVNALATELGRDRRTVAKALDGVPADGTIKGNPAWHLGTALDALWRPPGTGAGGGQAGSLLEELFVQRLRDWREITARGGRPHECTIEEFCRMSGKRPDAVLAWLRAGMPYVRAGDWETGEGFVLAFSWTLDWSLLVFSVAHRYGEAQAGRELRVLD